MSIAIHRPDSYWGGELCSYEMFNDKQGRWKLSKVNFSVQIYDLSEYKFMY